MKFGVLGFKDQTQEEVSSFLRSKNHQIVELNYHSEDVSPTDELDFIVAINSIPFELDLLRYLHLLQMKHCTVVPTLILSEEISPSSSELVDELELSWLTYLPFKRKKFEKAFDKTLSYCTKQSSLIEKRREINSLRAAGQLNEAVQLIDKIVDKYSHPEQLRITKAKILISLVKKSKAFELLRKLKKHGLETSSVKLLLSDQEDKSYELLLDLQYNRIEIDNLFFWGEKKFYQGDFESACEIFQQVLDMGPTPTEEYNAIIYLKVCETLGLETNTPQVKGVDPGKVVKELNSRIQDFVRTGSAVEIENIYNTLIQQNPQFLDSKIQLGIWYNLGLACKKSGFYEEALTYFKKSRTCGSATDSKTQKQIDATKKLLEGYNDQSFSFKPMPKAN